MASSHGEQNKFMLGQNDLKKLGQHSLMYAKIRIDLCKTWKRVLMGLPGIPTA